MTTQERRLAGRYVLDTPIGRGGMGEVWRATDTVLGRQVAIKTIDLTRVPDESGAVRFEREARVTAGLNHPHVVTVHDTGVEGDTAYLVMELLPGPSLAERLREGPFAVDDVVDVVRQVAGALQAAHGRGLVHRDIKPANVVTAADGRLRVLDFGITQLGDASTQQALTATHTVMGTAEYLSPEQAMGGRVDGRADLYALGCLAFALLTGEPPFSGPTAVATMMMHTHDPVPDVRDLRPDTPAWLAGLVSSLLAKDPADRPADAGAVLAAVDARRAPTGGAAAAGAAAAATTVLPAGGADRTQRLSSTPLPPPPPPTTGLPPREPERRRGASTPWVLAILALLVVGLVGWYLVTSQDDTGGADASPSASPTASAQQSAPEQSTPAETTPEPEPTTASPEPTPSETPSDTPTDTAPDGTPVTDAYASLQEAVQQAAADGTVDAKVARDVARHAQATERALSGADARKVSDEAQKLADEYAKAVEDGSVSADATGTLDPLVQAVLDAADAYAGG
ncbi:serine/threonine-protein kinase [Phycicoccus sp. DTK01]|uniref:serine/threonine-protein kinase n=1 Tax=Phycicoccus sp. DTK01 TaxID=2785745 RepID=UPI001A8D4BFF|nr:serine/threonine-protein kinase [Phycicoccus sp. DTK01]GIL34481.1 hypothetical protein PDTK01_05580 [Phycicoccus sp. DTK01]